MSSKAHPRPHPGPLAIFSLHRPVCWVRLETDLVFTEKDITNITLTLPSAHLLLQP